MTPEQMSAAAAEIGQRWPDALIYPNPPPSPNGCIRNPDVPAYALAVDVDRVWPHTCPDDDDECFACYGRYGLSAWIDTQGVVHYVDTLRSV